MGREKIHNKTKKCLDEKITLQELRGLMFLKKKNTKRTIILQ